MATLKELIESKKGYTYKELTNLLEIEYKSGYAKTKQLNELCEYIKEGTKYYIIREYDEVDRVMMNLSRGLLEPMLYLLYEDLSNCSGGAKSYSKDELLILLGIVNTDMRHIRHGDEATLLDADVISEEDLSMVEYTKVAGKFFNNSVDNVLKRVKKNVGFEVIKTFRLHKTERLDNGMVLYSRLDVTPMSEESRIIGNIRTKALKECGYPSGNYEAFMYYAKDYLKTKYFELCNRYTRKELGYDRFTIVTRISVGEKTLKFTKEHNQKMIDDYYKDKTNGQKDIMDLFWDKDKGKFKINVEEYYNLITDKSNPLQAESKLRKYRKRIEEERENND